MRSLIFCVLSVSLLAACSSQQAQDLELGKSLYSKNCKVCHAQGINGAPILGNKKMWAKRAGQGYEVLLSHATEGYGLMPAKGGNNALSDDEVGKVIKYMLSQLK